MLTELEALAWSVYLDAHRSDKGSPHVFETWKRLWEARKIEVPIGAWECP